MVAKKQIKKRTVKKYPLSLIVYISYGRNGKNYLRAHESRDEIEEKWAKFGRWVGHGSDIDYNGYCDVQVNFENESGVEKAKKIANEIISKHKVSGKYKIFNA